MWGSRKLPSAKDVALCSYYLLHLQQVPDSGWRQDRHEVSLSPGAHGLQGETRLREPEWVGECAMAAGFRAGHGGERGEFHTCVSDVALAGRV